MGTHYFDHHTAEANKFLVDLAHEIHEPENLSKAERVLRAVLHTLRDRLTKQESFQFMAQLPLFLKGIFVSEWKYGKKPTKIKHLDEFIKAAKMKNHGSGEDDFGNDEKSVFIVNKVFKVLGRYVSPGEWQDIADNLPHDLHAVIKPAFT